MKREGMRGKEGRRKGAERVFHILVFRARADAANARVKELLSHDGRGPNSCATFCLDRGQGAEPEVEQLGHWLLPILGCRGQLASQWWFHLLAARLVRGGNTTLCQILTLRCVTGPCHEFLSFFFFTLKIKGLKPIPVTAALPWGRWGGGQGGVKLCAVEARDRNRSDSNRPDF